MTFSETHWWCKLTEMLCSSASKLSFWLRYLPWHERLGKSVTLVRYVGFKEKSWRSAKLKICVGRRKCSARQLPNSHSGWDSGQARAVCRSVSRQVRCVEFEDSCRLSVRLNINVARRKCSASQLPNSRSVWDPVQGQERFGKKCLLTGSIPWSWIKLVTFSETQYRCT